MSKIIYIYFRHPYPYLMASFAEDTDPVQLKHRIQLTIPQIPHSIHFDLLVLIWAKECPILYRVTLFSEGSG